MNNLNRDYRTLRLTKKGKTLFYNKHTESFDCEIPKRINNHIGLNEALEIQQEYIDLGAIVHIIHVS